MLFSKLILVGISESCQIFDLAESKISFRILLKNKRNNLCPLILENFYPEFYRYQIYKQ